MNENPQPPHSSDPDGPHSASAPPRLPQGEETRQATTVKPRTATGHQAVAGSPRSTHHRSYPKYAAGSYRERLQEEVTTAEQAGDQPASRLEHLLSAPGLVVRDIRDRSEGKDGWIRAAWMLCLSLILLAGYGLVMGSFSGGDQWWQLPLKTPLLVLGSLLLCLPSLYIFANLSGGRTTFVGLIQLLAGATLLSATLLAGFAPIAWIFSTSTSSLVLMAVIHILIWIISFCIGLRFLGAGHRVMARQRSSLLSLWVCILIVVLLQMTTNLRPLLGPVNPAQTGIFSSPEKQFFLSHWGNVLIEGE